MVCEQDGVENGWLEGLYSQDIEKDIGKDTGSQCWYWYWDSWRNILLPITAKI